MFTNTIYHNRLLLETIKLFAHEYERKGSMNRDGLGSKLDSSTESAPAARSVSESAAAAGAASSTTRSRGGASPGLEAPPRRCREGPRPSRAGPRRPRRCREGRARAGRGLAGAGRSRAGAARGASGDRAAGADGSGGGGAAGGGRWSAAGPGRQQAEGGAPRKRAVVATPTPRVAIRRGENWPIKFKLTSFSGVVNSKTV